jgi:autoinducer-2 kinase
LSATARLLAVDVGTGSCRAAIFDENGNQLAIGQREYSHAELPGVPGSQVFDTETVWRLVCECIREALQRSSTSAGSIAAVSTSSMREGMVCYDAGGRELWACPNVDARAALETSELIESGMADTIFACSGDWVSITAPARLKWLARHEPDVFDAIAHVGMIGDWVLYRLSGTFVTDPSLGSSSGMFELGSRSWSRHIVESCGLDPSVFPEVVPSGTAVGAVTRGAANDCGLQAGTPVVTGGADTQLALVGMGITETGRFVVVGGSFWQHTMTVKSPLVDPDGRLRTLCHAVSDQWMLEGIGFYSGMALRWFRDAFYATEREQAEKQGADVYELLEREAADVPPGSNGVVGIFSNLMNAKRWVHASPAFIGFDVLHPDRSGRKQCLRAIEEAAAYVAYGHLKIVEDIASCSIQEVAFTGGASKGTLWPRILADVLGRPVSIPEVKESTALGAAIYAGVGVGLYGDAAEIAGQLARTERTLDPDPQAHRAYEGLYNDWCALYAGALTLSEQGLAPPLWRAPGT